MTIDTIKNLIPSYAKDIKLNLSSLVNDETLSPQQLWGCMLASALACGQSDLIQGIYAEAQNHMDEQTLEASKAAASIMAMNNIYYRYTHITKIDTLSSMPAKLRMNIIANPGAPVIDFELWSLAVSVINGCGLCIDAHADKLMKKGLSKEQVQTAARIAAVIHAAARTIDGEQALSAA